MIKNKCGLKKEIPILFEYVVTVMLYVSIRAKYISSLLIALIVLVANIMTLMIANVGLTFLNQKPNVKKSLLIVLVLSPAHYCKLLLLFLLYSNFP